MVNKKSLFKDAFREIKATKKKFLSLLLIVVLGVGFYVGLKSASLDMKETAKSYYEDTNFMDLKVISSTGFKKDDITTFKNINGVEGVMAVKSLDATTTIKNEDYVIKLHDINDDRSSKNEDYINRLVLTSGKFPTTINEGLVEEDFLRKNNLKLGDLVTLSLEDSSKLKAKKIKIVGTVRNSYYSSKERGTSSLGDGKADYFIYLNENNFNLDYYSELYITLKDSNNLDTYSKKYENFAKEYQEEILAKTDELTIAKHKTIKEELEYNIKYLENSLNELYQMEIPNDSLDEQIKQISDQLEEAKNSLKQLENPASYVLTRNQISSFYEYKAETERITYISKVFPLIFFLVAALVSLTSMTRMVDEERTELGTLSAIGYGKFDIVLKYLFYAFFTSFIGSILGSLLFYKIIPIIISKCYSIFYEMPKLITLMQFNHIILASLLACMSTVLATIFVFVKYIIEMPASLMRPKAPTPGKRVLLEKIKPIWSKLSFSNKVTFRNIFRFKKRLFMTLIGICGCTSLLLTAFGLKDSVTSIVDKQFNKINKYDLQVNINSNLSTEEKEKIEKTLNSNKNVEKLAEINQSNIKIENKNYSENANLIIPKEEDFSEFISLQSRKSKNKLHLKDNGIIISEKLSKLLKVNKGDKVTLNINNKKVSTKVLEISESYIDHYIYMTPNTYKKLLNEDVKYNSILVNTKDLNKKEQKEISTLLNEQENIISSTFTTNTFKTYKDMMSVLNYVSLILIAAAAALAFVVLYNLASINISERKRELATIKVLGFYDEEVTNYVHKETINLTITGALIGLIFGSFLTYYVIKTCETNLFLFSFDIKIMSYLLSFLITIIFLLIVNIFMHYDLKKLDMIEALKSVE